MAQEVVSTQLFGEHLAYNPQNLVPPPLVTAAVWFLALASRRHKLLPGLWKFSVTSLLLFCQGQSLRGDQSQSVLDEPLLQCLVYTCFMFSIRGFCLRKQVTFIVQREIIRLEGGVPTGSLLSLNCRSGLHCLV